MYTISYNESLQIQYFKKNINYLTQCPITFKYLMFLYRIYALTAHNRLHQLLKCL